MSSSTVSGRSSLCLPFVSTWMLRGHATRSWLVVILAPFFLRGLCPSNLMTVSVHQPEWVVPAGSVSLYQLGIVARELQRVI